MGTIILTVLHVVVSIFLILVILLQTGKGAEMGAMFGGGGANTVFGSSGAGGFLSKLTTYGAVVFMVNCLILAYLGGHSDSAVLRQLERDAPVSEFGDEFPPAPSEAETEAQPFVTQDDSSVFENPGKTSTSKAPWENPAADESAPASSPTENPGP